MEQDKMRNEMDKFFDASGSVVSPQISLVFLFLLKVFIGTIKYMIGLKYVIVYFRVVLAPQLHLVREEGPLPI